LPFLIPTTKPLLVTPPSSPQALATAFSIYSKYLSLQALGTPEIGG
jgi:hypothetical protein